MFFTCITCLENAQKIFYGTKMKSHAPLKKAFFDTPKWILALEINGGTVIKYFYWFWLFFIIDISKISRIWGHGCGDSRLALLILIHGGKYERNRTGPLARVVLVAEAEDGDWGLVPLPPTEAHTHLLSFPAGWFFENCFCLHHST